MLLNEMVLYHKALVYLLLFSVILGYMFSVGNNIDRIKRRFRVYTFTLHGLISTVGFGGLIAFVFAKVDINLNISIMIISYIVLIVFEIIKYLKILRSKDIKEIRAINLKWTLLSTTVILLNFWRY